KKTATRVAMNFPCPLDDLRLSISPPRASARCTPPRPEEPLTQRTPNTSFYGNDPHEEAWTHGDQIESAVAVSGPTPAERRDKGASDFRFLLPDRRAGLISACSACSRVGSSLSGRGPPPKSCRPHASDSDYSRRCPRAQARPTRPRSTERTPHPPPP